MQHLIGIPYSKMHCWQACQRYYKDILKISLEYEFNHDVDDKNLNCSLIKANKGNFVRINEPKEHDLIILKIHGVECHIGIYLGNGLFFHTTKKTGSVIDKVIRWRKMIEGYYRHDSI